VYFKSVGSAAALSTLVTTGETADKWLDSIRPCRAVDERKLLCNILAGSTKLLDNTLISNYGCCFKVLH